MHLCFYSVPARNAGRRLSVRFSARTVEISDDGKIVARHERGVGKYVEVLTPARPPPDWRTSAWLAS